MLVDPDNNGNSDKRGTHEGRGILAYCYLAYNHMAKILEGRIGHLAENSFCAHVA